MHRSQNKATCSFVDTPASLEECIDSLLHLPYEPPSLYLHLQGEDPSRDGSVSIITVLVLPENHTFLIDVCKLNKETFTITGTDSKSLKDVLETPQVPKVFFDVRNAADVLFSHFGIALRGVQDIQLMEDASRFTRNTGKRFLGTLSKCVERDALITFEAKQRWTNTRMRGEELYDPEKGGSYEVFNSRPLMEDILHLCVLDVRYLPLLRDLYWGRLDSDWRIEVEEETVARVHLSQREAYQPHGADKALSPWQGSQHDNSLNNYLTCDDDDRIDSMPWGDHIEDDDRIDSAQWDDRIESDLERHQDYGDDDFGDWTGVPRPK
ncbi:hypothetical protein AOQ84DRAFT_371419 [Glonium stellatum]|uniref:3'-5' exonuclease domain-containing protein n=1 Tax=Glonium stellatum TaxID=574774 RepID=A0A8E2FBU1_9PEZI|nr:hypothetical protein AOQ84DRAFT_371419 [Glonium stellatum]